MRAGIGHLFVRPFVCIFSPGCMCRIYVRDFTARRAIYRVRFSPKNECERKNGGIAVHAVQLNVGVLRGVTVHQTLVMKRQGGALFSWRSNAP